MDEVGNALNTVPRTLNERLESWRAEILGNLDEMTTFSSKDTIEILRLLSSYSARASWIRNICVRSGSKIADNFRIKELDPFLGEVDRQFKVWSRIASVMTTEWEISRGGH